MDASALASSFGAALDRGRPWKFLVSTTDCVGNLKRHLGSADYSYGFVLKALAPVLEQVGSWELVPRPESSLIYQAAQAAEAGYRPVQFSLTPAHAAYLTPAVPTILYPFWEFPRIPDRDFGFDTRQNWARVARRADLVLTACRLTAGSFQAAGVGCPVEIVPVPLDPEDFVIPDWDPARTVRIRCRHVVRGGESASRAHGPASLPEPPLQGLARLERALRVRYHRHVRPWLSDRAVERITRVKRTVLRKIAEPPPRVPDGDLELSGLVYTSVFNLGDHRKNPRDLLSATLLAFRDRPDVTIVLKLAANPATEWHELRTLQHLLDELGIDHHCRLVVIPDFLTEEQMRALLEGTTYYLNTSRAEGACLPLQRALAAGRPGIAPAHTAMADYMDEAVGFVVDSHAEPTHWPHDPQRRCETTWHRLVWTSLHDRLRESAAIAGRDEEQYATRARAARCRMTETASRDVAAEALRRALRHLESVQPGRLAWSA